MEPCQDQILIFIKKLGGKFSTGLQKAGSTTKERYAFMQFLYKHRGLILSKHVPMTDNQNVLKEWHMNGLEGSKFFSLYEYAQIHHRQVIHVKRRNNLMELVDQSARQLVSNEEQESGKEPKPKSRQKNATEEEIPNERKKDQVCCNHDFMYQEEECRGEFLRVA